MAIDGTVQCWDDDAGWCVIDTAETPRRLLGALQRGCYGFRTLHAGRVSVIWERAEQDGYAFRAVTAAPQ